MKADTRAACLGGRNHPIKKGDQVGPQICRGQAVIFGQGRPDTFTPM